MNSSFAVTRATQVNNETSVDVAYRYSYPNGSCPVRTPEELAMVPPEYLDAEELFQRRLLLRIPTWIFTVVSIYMSVMLVVDAVRRSKRGKVDNRNVRIFRYGLVFACCFTSTHFIFVSVSLFIEVRGNINCNALFRVANALYWGNISILYAVLWLRQRVVYSQRSLRQVVSRVTSFFSYAAVIMVVALPVANSSLFSVTVNFCYDEAINICRHAMNRDTPLYSAVKTFELTAPIVVPLTLLGLFAWPLISYHLDSERAAKGHRSIVRVLRWIVIATSICLATDIIAMVCSDKCEISIAPVFRDLSVFVNMICVFVSFGDWKGILLPMLRKNDRRRSESVATRTHASITSSPSYRTRV